ncbi:MAG: hypothetical protein IPN29_04420 [Saprospiraceae bacterium]|nr:hypothetical protein [Saprospiraceae bacterium]
MKLILSLAAAFILLSFHSGNEPWVLSKEKNGITVHTRKKEGENLKEFKATSTFNCTKEKLEKEFMNVRQMHLWYDMVEKVELLKEISPTEAVYKIYFDFPSLAGDRYSTIKAVIKKETGTGDLLVDTKYFPITHKPEEDRVFVTKIESHWRVSGRDGQLQVEHSAFMDPSGSIPQWIINATLTDGPIKTLTNLRKRACS